MAKAKPDAWMPLFIEPWTTKTARLPAAARGAYLDLILAYWSGEKLPADDDDALMRMARCTEREWKEIGSKVLAFFARDGQTLINVRADEEKAKAKQRYEQKSIAGKAGGKQKRSRTQAEHKADTPAEPQADVQAESIAERKRQGTHLEHLVHSPDGEKEPASQGADAPLKDQIFGPCLQWLMTRTGKTRQQIAPIVGKWCSKHGDGPTLEMINAAAKNSPLGDPIAYVTAGFARGGAGQRPSQNGSSSGGIANIVARLKAESGVERQDDDPWMGRGSGGLQTPRHDGGKTDASPASGGPILDADDAERMFRAARGTEADHDEPGRPGARPGGTTENLRAQAPRVPGGRGASCADEPIEPQQMVADMGGVEGSTGLRVAAPAETQGSADKILDYEPDIGPRPDFLRRVATR